MYVCLFTCMYVGPKESVLPYFATLGFVCPRSVDVADFLQIIATPEGRMYMREQHQPQPQPQPQIQVEEKLDDFSIQNVTDESSSSSSPSSTSRPHNSVRFDGVGSTETLVRIWKDSDLFKRMMTDSEVIISPPAIIDEETGYVTATSIWLPELKEKFAGSYWYHLNLTFTRQFRILKRDKVFIFSRIIQKILVGAIGGSVYNNIKPYNLVSMDGFLFFTALFGAFSCFDLLSLLFAQKLIHAKHSRALFYPDSCFILSQSLVLMPQQFIEDLCFCTIM